MVSNKDSSSMCIQVLTLCGFRLSLRTYYSGNINILYSSLEWQITYQYSTETNCNRWSSFPYSWNTLMEWSPMKRQGNQIHSNLKVPPWNSTFWLIIHNFSSYYVCIFSPCRSVFMFLFCIVYFIIYLVLYSTVFTRRAL